MLQPESAIAEWRQWSAGLKAEPVILGPLNDGRSNRSFLLDANGARLVLRINAVNESMAADRRLSETAIWQAASRRGIAPELVFADRNAAYLVSAFIETTLPDQPQLDTTLVNRAITLLERCHELEINAPLMDYTGHIQRYWRLIEARGSLTNQALQAQREPMQETLEFIQNSSTPTGLCHHDPVVANFVGTAERLYLIDWEYAANGLQIMDYAALIVEWQLDDRMVARRTGLETDLLKKATQVYQYLCGLWQALWEDV